MSEVNFGDINHNFDLNNLKIGQKKEDLKYLNKTQLSIFDAIDTNEDGVLSKEEVDALKDTIKKYTEDAGDNNFSLKDAKKVLKEFKQVMKDKGGQLKANNDDLIQFLYQLFTQSGKNKYITSNENTTKVMNEYGSGKKIEEYDNKTGKLNGTEVSWENYKTKYDEKNELTERSYSNDNFGDVKETYENGKLSKKEMEKSGVKTTIEYEPDGITPKKMIIKSSKQRIETTYKNGKITQEKINQKNDDELTYTIKNYENDKIVSEHKYGDNLQKIDINYRYDDSGKRTGSTSTNHHNEQMICGSDGKVLYFKLKDDDTMYPNLGQWIVDKFNKGESIKQYFIED